MRNPWHRFVEALLPWYDPKAERARNEQTERIIREAREARNRVGEVRVAYQKMAEAVRRDPR